MSHTHTCANAHPRTDQVCTYVGIVCTAVTCPSDTVRGKSVRTTIIISASSRVAQYNALRGRIVNGLALSSERKRNNKCYITVNDVGPTRDIHVPLVISRLSRYP